MSKKLTLAIDIGHNVNFDRGAIGIRNEDILNYEVGSKLMEECRGAGIKVVNCTPKSAVSLYDSLNQRVAAANNNGADFFISIHHNVTLGGHGCEILCIKGGRAESIANIILPELVNLGLANRGVKDRRDLFVLNKTNMSAILIECAFCDSEEDMRNYDTSKVAHGIFVGLCKAFGIEAQKELNKVSASPYHTVVKGDTLYGISKKYAVAMKDIISLNNISNGSLIKPGQKIRIK